MCSRLSVINASDGGKPPKTQGVLLIRKPGCSSQQGKDQYSPQHGSGDGTVIKT